MATFRLLEHTADIGIAASAEARTGLVEQSGFALQQLLYGTVRAEGRQTQGIRATGNAAEETLVNLLNELLFLLVNGEQLLAAISVETFSDTEIIATVSSEPFDPARHCQLREIKAVTHHQTLVAKDDAGWHSAVFLDL